MFKLSPAVVNSFSQPQSPLISCLSMTVYWMLANCPSDIMRMIGNSLKYMCAKNHQNRVRFYVDITVTRIKRCAVCCL